MSKRFFLLVLVIAVTALTTSCTTKIVVQSSPTPNVESGSAEDLYDMTKEENVLLLRSHFLRWIDDFRKIHKKPPLAWNPKLNKMAEMWAETHKDEGLYATHEHMGSSPKKRANQAGYYYDHLSENVARAQKPDGGHVFDIWLKSEKHKENMLGPSTHLGFACVHAPYGAADTPQYVCVAVFGSHL